MYMHFGHDLLDGVTNIKVGLAGILRVDATLQTHLGRTPIKGLSCATHNFFMR